MIENSSNPTVIVLDVSGLPYAGRLCAAALQGLANREGPLVFLDYGIYDDPLARRTNEVFLDDELWFKKYRALLGNQDQNNLAYYQRVHGIQPRLADGLDELVTNQRSRLQGCVVWDESLPDTANIALMLAAQEDLLVVEAGMLEWAAQHNLAVRHDLRGRWTERLALYAWAFEHLFAGCKPGQIACIEPGWQRPEFVDYLVEHKIFTYSLAAKSGGIGDTLLLLLAFGPPWLRETLFALRLDGLVRRLGLVLMGRRSAEAGLANRLQQAVKALPYPTIFGWHTKRDDELAFMLQLSANGLRLAPSHLAGNFSFHSQVPALAAPVAELAAPAAGPETGPAALDPQGVYLTFTLSDGDQLMMMNSAELGNWHSPLRGSIPFNWETQPLLHELAPALLDRLRLTAAPNDCLVAGPSGAGYVIPPLAPDLPAYLRESRRVCLAAGMLVITFYVPDPPRRVFEQMAQHASGLAGWLAGYGILERAPQCKLGPAMFVSNQWPPVAHIWDQAGDVLEGVRRLAEAPGARPRFIGVHLFAYRTTYADVVAFVRGLKNPHIHVLRGDDFLRAAYLAQNLRGEKNSV